MAVQRSNPYSNFNFVVDLGDGQELGLESVDLPVGAVQVVEYRDGTDKESHARKLPGRVDYNNVVLRRGVSGNVAFYDWWNATRNGANLPRNVIITLLDEQRNPVLVWKLRNAWPVELGYSTLDALGNESVIEELELTYERFDVE